MPDAGVDVRHVDRHQAKCFILGSRGMLGSANLTGAGLDSSVNANRELGVELDADQLEEARTMISIWPSRSGRKVEIQGSDEWYITCPTCGMQWVGGSTVLPDHQSPAHALHSANSSHQSCYRRWVYTVPQRRPRIAQNPAAFRGFWHPPPIATFVLSELFWFGRSLFS